MIEMMDRLGEKNKKNKQLATNRATFPPLLFAPPSQSVRLALESASASETLQPRFDTATEPIKLRLDPAFR